MTELSEFWGPLGAGDFLQEPANKQPPLPLRFLDITAWHGQPVPIRQWCVINRLPLRNVTLLSGDGGVGKSIVALQLAAAVVLDGSDWLGGIIPTHGPAMVLACEDDEEELHFRMSSVVAHHGASFTDLKNLHLKSLAGEDALLAVPDRSGLIKPTALFHSLKLSALEIRPRLIVLDNSADVFGGSENDRAQVRQLIALLRGLAISANAAVLLTSHPSLKGQESGSGLSGTTAWHASVRSRMYMKRATTERDEEPDPSVRVIEIMKANYGPVGESVNVRWQDGVFDRIAAMGTLDKLAADQHAEHLFLKLLAQLTEQGPQIARLFLAAMPSGCLANRLGA
jgi:RecA-family ATPase